MTPEEQVRRQLRFALFLQIAGAAMFALAASIRAVAIGFDMVTSILVLITLLIIAAAVFTRRKMRQLAP